LRHIEPRTGDWRGRAVGNKLSGQELRLISVAPEADSGDFPKAALARRSQWGYEARVNISP
jgi:hypothetical protein